MKRLMLAVLLFIPSCIAMDSAQKSLGQLSDQQLNKVFDHYTRDQKIRMLQTETSKLSSGGY